MLVNKMKILILIGALFAIIVNGKQGFGPTDQEWGYVTVRKNAHMFWWLHYTSANVTKYTDRPLIVWLQGGPGSSSTSYGNFFELGPLDENLKPRNTSWDKHANILFVDNPVGTGFSYVDNKKSYAKTNKQIGTDFVELMQGFYKAVPAMREVPLYIFSESYGGKMAVDIALELHEAIKSGSLKCDLRGVGLGDSSISPVDCDLSYAPYLRAVGMIDKNGYDKIMKKGKKVEEYLKNGEYKNASIEENNTLGAIYEAVGNIDIYNILTKINPPAASKKGIFRKLLITETEETIMNNMVKKALNISQTWGVQSWELFDVIFEDDYMKPVVTGVEKLLNDTDIEVAVYTGQLDAINNIIGAIYWMDNMHWKNKTQYQAQKQQYFVVDDIIEGYTKKYANLQFYLILRAGHMVPADNPAGMYYILKTVTNNFSV